MAFFKSFQQTLPSVNISSILDSVTSRVDDLANAVSDATYAVSDQLTEQVTTIMNKVQEEEVVEHGNTPEKDQATQEGKTFWQMSRDSDSGNAGSKGNQSNDGAEGENTQSQMEWEWRDGCWRVKKTEAELEEEERRKREEKELQERKEQRRKERRQKQLEKEGLSQRKEDEGGQEREATEVSDTLENSTNEECGDQLTAQQRSDDSNETDRSLDSKTETSVLKNEEEGSEEEADNEEEADPSASSSKVKKKKPDKKLKSSSDTSKKSEERKKSKKKQKGEPEEVASGSEEEKDPEAATPENLAFAWSGRSKQSSEQDGFSSEASSEQVVSIQRMRKDSELQPPPYQDESSGARRSSRSRSERGLRSCDSLPCSSEASMDQDAESFLNKGCEEDIPSDSTAVLGPEDGSGPRLPKLYEPEPLAKYGTLDVAFEYDSSEQWLAVTVTAATDIPALKQTGNISWQVHLVLLPTKKQRAKTGVQKGPCPVFTETFKFSRVEQEALGDCAVRFRLYSIRRMKKEKVLGEKVFYLTKLNLQGKIALPVTLEPGSELPGCGSLVSVSRSAGALSYRSTEDSLPEILLGLIYNSATGRLSAEVIQGNHFKTAASEKPISDLFCCVKHFVGGQLYIMRDTYVKLTMLDSKGKEMSKCKTATCRGHPNPTYKETFVFQVALFQLSEVSLVVSVFCRRSSMRPRERLGWVSLGHNSSSEEQLVHWTEMREAEGQQICHWHTLTDT